MIISQNFKDFVQKLIDEGHSSADTLKGKDLDTFYVKFVDALDLYSKQLYMQKLATLPEFDIAVIGGALDELFHKKLREFFSEEIEHIFAQVWHASHPWQDFPSVHRKMMPIMLDYPSDNDFSSYSDIRG